MVVERKEKGGRERARRLISSLPSTPPLRRAQMIAKGRAPGDDDAHASCAVAVVVISRTSSMLLSSRRRDVAPFPVSNAS